MSLTKQEIEKAVYAEKNAGEFPQLMQEFKKMGVKRYDYLVAEGMYRYFDDESSIDLPLNGKPKEVAAQSDHETIKAVVKRAQAGEFDFETFCELAGQAGVPFWTSDLVLKQVVYYDTNHQALLIEPIPGL
ncbi:DUF1398 family protein [Carnobacterium pleistocenium]|uniref:DUF1398 family protein n=1 Tax=Carnobacterium pleistocenium TaxID=181073 RepID=UPI0005545054|nr:DUF1398 family protein [Carnobacterium pleistocenium]